MPTCYRHPDRETNVACSNCERPICPDCMISTPVGMRCPECARERTQVRRVDFSGLSRGAAPATFALIVVNAVAFVAEILGGGGATSLQGGGSLLREGGLCAAPIADGGVCGNVLYRDGGEWWRLVTSGFLHAGPFHLLLNMFALYILGSLLEPAVGTARFLGIYVVSLLAGSLGALLLDPGVVTVGASGAVFGLMSATFVMARRRGFESLASQIGIYVAINLVFTFSVPNISVGGHLGGLVGGGLVAISIAYFERRGRGRPGLGEAAVMTLMVVGAFAAALAAASAADVQLIG